MEENYEKQYHDVEGNHWWFKSRRNFLLDLLSNAPKNSKILDIGCSSGMFINDLMKAGFQKENLFGIDISENAIANCKKNGIQNSYVMDAQNITLEEKFDILIASDSLEHLEDDAKALQNWKSLLKPNGKMYIFVPAFMSLWSHHDEVNMHYRRYTNEELQQKLKAQNLTLEKTGYWNCFLFPPVYLFRKINNLIGKNKSEEGDIKEVSPIVNSLLVSLVSFENKLLKYVRLPAGVSTFCIAKKKTV